MVLVGFGWVLLVFARFGVFCFFFGVLFLLFCFFWTVLGGWGGPTGGGKWESEYFACFGGGLLFSCLFCSGCSDPIRPLREMFFIAGLCGFVSGLNLCKNT